MKHKIRITQHGTAWVDPTPPPPVIICPECGGDHVRMDIFTYGSNVFYFFGLLFRRVGNENVCKDCGCHFVTNYSYKLQMDDWAEWFLFLAFFNLIAFLLLFIFTNWESPSLISEIVTPFSIIACIANFLLFAANT